MEFKYNWPGLEKRLNQALGSLRNDSNGICKYWYKSFIEKNTLAIEGKMDVAKLF